MPAKINFTKEQKIEIATEYTTNESLSKLALKYSVDRSVIKRLLLESNITIRNDSSTRKSYKNNKNLFDTTNEGDAYWIGFIAADGCLVKGGFAIALQLALKDIGHLGKFKDFLGANNPVKTTQTAAIFNFRDETAYKNLVNWGLTPAKSLTLKINEALIYNRHFWRGFVDGDGSWGRDKKYNNLSFAIKVGSLPIMEQFQLFCTSLKLKSNILLRDGKYYSITFGKRQSEILANHLYDSNNVCLERKLKIINGT